VIAVLQFDAASAALLERLLAEGRLPNLAALHERGRRVELAGPAAQFPASAYQSLYRGVEIGDHGLFYPFQWSAPDQRIRLASHFAAPPPIWERLARANRTTLAIDPYECHPPGASAGVTVSGFGLRERVVLGRWSRPPGFDRALRRRYGAPPDVTEVFGEQDAGERATLRERFLQGPQRVAGAALDMLRDRSFDLVWLTFAAPHLAGHRLFPAPSANGAGPDDALADIYARTDEQLGRVLGALPDGTDVIACSVLGMDVNTSRADMLPAMLAAVL